MVKRIKVNRVHFPDWDDGELMFMLMEKRVWAFFSRNPLYFIFLKVKANNTFQAFKRRSNSLKTILFFRVSKGCFKTVTMYKWSSNHLRKTKKENGNYVLTRTRGSSSQIWHEVKSIEVRQTLKCSCLRNGVVWGSSLMHSSLFVMPQSQCPRR
jgi:hypothetical protein